MDGHLLEVENLSLLFDIYDTGFRRKKLEVMSGLSLKVNEGEVLAIVGSSGSGKSLLANAVLGILPDNCKVSGSIKYKGDYLTEKRLKKLRGREIVYVPQSVNNLDPRMKVGKQVIGAYGTKKKQREVFSRYGLGPEVDNYYPYQLSGGMARRVLIATALMHEAKLVVADEPTPGMSLDMAEETLKNFREMADNGCGVIIITHDIDLALLVADKIAVFYSGLILEIALREDFEGIGEKLRHPYSKALWNALPQNLFCSIKGTQPYAGYIKDKCIFAPRCNMCTKECMGNIELRKVRGGEVRCCHAV